MTVSIWIPMRLMVQRFIANGLRHILSRISKVAVIMTVISTKSAALSDRTVRGLERRNAMKYCEYCGTQLNDDAGFCNKCGKQQRISGNQVTPIRTENNVTNMGIVINVFVILISAAVSIFVLLQVIAPWCRPLRASMWIEGFTNLYWLLDEFGWEQYMFIIAYTLLAGMSILTIVGVWRKRYGGALAYGLISVIPSFSWTIKLAQVDEVIAGYAGFGIKALQFTRIAIPLALITLFIIEMNMKKKKTQQGCEL